MMRRSRAYVPLIAAITFLLAACSSPQAMQQETDEVLAPAKSASVLMASLPDWSSDSDLTVDVLGMGLGNSNDAVASATFPIPNPSNVVKVYVQVITKAGSSGVGAYTDPTEVEIAAFDDANASIASKTYTGGTVERVDIRSQLGASGTTGYSHEAEFTGQVASIQVDLSNNTIASFPYSPRALIVSVFRDVGDGTSSAGTLPNVYVFGNAGFPDAVQTIALPAGFAGGDVTVTFAISDLEMFMVNTTDNDPRIIHYAASAGGVSANATVDVPNMGADLAIVDLVLSNVPAGTTEVEASLYSPHRNDENPWGDSVYWNTVSVQTADVPDTEVGSEGCTPGYWRQEHHFDSWTKYTPDQLFSDVFGEVITVRTGGRSTANDPTLLQAVWAVGGGVNALARHATAALLNTASAGVDYPYTTAEVIDRVQAAIASGDYETTKNLLADANELGCSLN